MLGAAAAGLALHSDAGAPAEEAGVHAGAVVAEAAPWQPPWLRPPRSVVLEDVRTQVSASDPLSRRPRRRVRLPRATAAVADPEPGSGIDVPASVADPDLVRARAGGGDIPPPDLGPELSLQADWLSTEAGDSLVLRAQGGTSAATAAAPEPATALLLAVGLVGLALWGRSV